ncbi:MAG: LLM class flavin-dependent oxidoreductase [Novosphingobium sp.]|nr:MAG: LLM class flavin-dependent oxidoreductase [Novosphingobium sp.]
MTTHQRKLHLGAILSGVGTTQNDWRHPDLPGDASVDIDWYIANARLAEAAKFDLVFIVDSPFITPDTAPHFLNRLEPLTLLSAVAVSTSKIGLAGTLTTSFWEPYNVARQFASLDLISKGRAAWNVVTTGLEGAAGNYGREAHFDHADRYRRAAEFLDVVKGLWDSYEDDAFPRDKAAGTFLDKSKQHRLDHKGEFFSVTGPLNIQRSRQGQPVIFQAGESEEGRAFGGAIAEGIYANAESFEQAREYYADVKARAATRGRNPDHVVILPGLIPVIAETDAEAQAIEEAQNGKLDLAKALVQLGRPFNYHDFGQYDLDAPFPDLGHLTLNSYKGGAERIIRTAQREGLTLRETAWRFAARPNPFVGSPETVADEIERWFLGGACDGFNYRVTNPAAFALFTDRVVPILQERGLFRTEYAGETLREHLGLPFPENRHALTFEEAVAAE